MAQIVMVIGQSGTGKSTSLRNFKKGECSVINVSHKPLPFPCNLNVVNTGDYETIKKLVTKTESNAIVIDDASYLIVNEYMSHAEEKGFDKYTNMAKNFWTLINYCIEQLPENKIIYLLGHSEKDDSGREHFKTVGKMLDNTVVLEGYSTVVLKTVVIDGKYQFATHNNGYDTVKTPYGMFEEDLIDNDLQKVDARLREYFKLDNKNADKGKETK